uniref:ZP domain-containing protein n=1 Tax=Syphacia muris TaxID=451379 RepID=A0A0N5AF11_9BILA
MTFKDDGSIHNTYCNCYILYSFRLISSNTLRVYPPLIFVDENFEIDSKLPVEICGNQSNLRIRSGDEYNTFKVFKINNTCSGLKLRRNLDADVSDFSSRSIASKTS